MNDFPSTPDVSGAGTGRAGRRSLSLRSTEFRRGREQKWRRLDELVGRIERSGISSLSADEIQSFPLLYRGTVSSLSVARGIVLDRNLLLYLENLALRAYLAVYAPRAGILSSLGKFFTRDFPRSVREMRWHLLVVLAFFVVGVAAGWALVAGDIGYYTMLVPRSLAGGRGPASSAAELRAFLFAPWPGFAGTFISFANFLFRHNTLVGIFAFGLGFALGVPTLLLVTWNGLILGAFVALHASCGLTVEAVGWLSIHGVTEILAILLCAAAGLVVGEKILFPGRLPRLYNLSLYGRRAAGVAAGAVLLFFIAGILEGGFRQLILSTPVRYLVAFSTAALWLYYFGWAGRKRRDGDAD